MDKEHWAYLYLNYAHSLWTLSLILLVLAWWFPSYSRTFIVSSAIVVIVILIFFRNPQFLNRLRHRRQVLVSPSSSRITGIHTNKGKTRIETHLSVLDEHVVVAPVSGTVTSVNKAPQATDVERKIITITDELGVPVQCEFAVSQIGRGPWIPAVLVDERVVTFPKKNDMVTQGERIGLIRFGSSSAIEFPSSTFDTDVAQNDYLTVGTDVLAKRK